MRIDARRPAVVLLTLLLLPIALYGWLVQADSLRVPGQFTYDAGPPVSDLELLAWQLLPLLELGVPIALVLLWLALGRPPLRAAPDRPEAAPLLLLSVFVWWSAADQLGLTALQWTELPWTTVTLLWWGWLAVALYVLHRQGFRSFKRWFHGGWHWPAVGLGIAATAVSWAIWTGLDQLIAWQLLTDEPNPMQTPLDAGPGIAVLDMMTTVAGAPVVEEIAYRGLLLGGLRAFVPDWLALVVSSALFALVHSYGLTGTLDVALLGALFGLLYLRTGSLLAPIACHAGINALSLL